MHAPRATLAGLFVAVIMALGGCRDATAPEGDLRLNVSPEAVGLDQASGTARVLYTIRNSGDTETLNYVGVAVEGETSPGVWRKIMDAEAAQYNNTLGSAVPPGTTRQRDVRLRLSPGRYRLRSSYRRSTAPAGDSTPSLEAFSNVFVVLPS